MKKNRQLDLYDHVAFIMAGMALEDMAAVVFKSRTRFRSGLRTGVRGLWNGSLGQVAFMDTMMTTFRLGFNFAWAEGASTWGISPDEYTLEERGRLAQLIDGQNSHIMSLGLDVLQNSRANGGKLGPLLARIESLWVPRYDQVVQEARTMTGKNKKLKWELGPTEHCGSCLALSNKVKRGSFWYERGILPRVPGATYLECRGYRCQCSLNPTTDPVSRGPLPAFIGLSQFPVDRI